MNGFGEKHSVRMVRYNYVLDMLRFFVCLELYSCMHHDEINEADCLFADVIFCKTIIACLE